MNELKRECEKRENDDCLREKIELGKEENTDVRYERTKDRGQDRREKNGTGSAKWDEAYEGGRR